MDELYQNIMKHLDLAEVIQRLSSEMLNLAEKDPTENIDSIAENRQRVVNLLSDIQKRIEDQLPQLKNPQDIQIVQAWHQDFNHILEDTNQKDEKLLQLLEEYKTQTKQEIGTVYRNHQKISAYNHAEKAR